MQLALFIIFLTIKIDRVTCGNEKVNNFLLIMIDDLRPVLGAYGDVKAHTPYIDELAADRRSVLFERAYAQQALCAPSRNSLLTSRRPDTLGLYDFYNYWRETVPGNFTTLPEHMKNNGYVTKSIGKVFHPGISSNFNDDSPYSWTEPPYHPYTERYKNSPVCSLNNSTTPASNLICPVQVSAMPNATLPDIEILKAAKKFLNVNGRKLFFLAVGFQKPHVPFKYPKRYLKYHPLHKFSLPNDYNWPKNLNNVAYNPWTDLRQRSDVKKLNLNCPWEKIPEMFGKNIIQSYYAAVTYIDNLVGKLLKKLDSMNIRDKTTIILTSDHGWSLGERAVWSKYSNFEVAVRVPLIISNPNGPNKLHFFNETQKKTSRYIRIVKEPVELLDVFPTIAELANCSISKCHGKKKSNVLSKLCSEGKSLVHLIYATSSQKSVKSSKIAISQYPRPGIEPQCHPSSDKPRLRNITIMGYSIRTIRYRYTIWVKFSHLIKKPNWQEIITEELYDHKTDFNEIINLAKDKFFQKIKSNLKFKLIKKLT